MKIYAYFLPQFYPTIENNKYWGEGFTDWVNTRKAKPLFPGHQQPLEAENNIYYDLSKIDDLRKVCKQASEFGIDGFGYWHYWFGNGFKTLEKVQEAHLSDKSIKQNFFFAWANADWTKSWLGDDKTIIFKQSYSIDSAVDHFKYIKPFIEDKRYIRYMGKPLFQVIDPKASGVTEYIKVLEELAKKELNSGFHWLFPSEINKELLADLEYSIVGYPPGDVIGSGMSGLVYLIQNKLKKWFKWILIPVVIPEFTYIKSFRNALKKSINLYPSYLPCLLSGWDNTPRYNERGFLIYGKKSELIDKQFKALMETYGNKNIPEIIFIKSWNEWAEGNIMEPYYYNGIEDFPAKNINQIKDGLRRDKSI